MPSLTPLTSRLAARAPRLAEAARRSAWKARNAPRTRGFRPDESLVDRALLDELRERGIAVRPFDDVFRDRARLDELRAIAERREAQKEGTAAKEFLERLMPSRVEAGGPFVALALEPQVVALANAYVGMRSYLRGLEMWRNLPTDEPPKLSQLWHRDWDDVVNLKLFVYLSDVTDESGPFTFAPGTQPGGPRQLDVKDRLSDDETADRGRPRPRAPHPARRPARLGRVRPHRRGGARDLPARGARAGRDGNRPRRLRARPRREPRGVSRGCGAGAGAARARSGRRPR